jgi:HK97 family phage portal protein
MASLISRISREIGKMFGFTRTTPLEPIQIGSNMPVYPDAKAETFINQGYAGNASVYTIISKDAAKFAHIKRGVYKITDKQAYKKLKESKTLYSSYLNAGIRKKLRIKAFGGELVEDSDLSILLNQPNPYQGQDSFFELLRVFYKTTGEGFIWCNRGEDDGQTDDDAWKVTPILEMFVIPSDKVIIIPDPDDVFGILYYEFDVNGERWRMRKVDVIHWKRPNPEFDATSRTHLRGLPPLQPGNKVLTQDDDATDAIVAMYQNGGARGILMDKSMKTLSPLQKSQIDDVISKKVNTNIRKAAVATLQGDWDYKELGQSSVDMQLLDGQDRAFVRLCNLLDVPPHMFMINQTYENTIQSIRNWINNSLVPAACSLRDEMNRVLLLAFKLGPSITTDIDPSDLPELQADMEKLVMWLDKAWWLTPNQKLDYMGEELSTDENMNKVYIPSTYQALEDVGLGGMNEDFNNNANDNANL